MKNMIKVIDTNKKNHKVAIKSWFDAVSTDDGIERFDHLHIDRIDDFWKLSNTWISAALESFRLALQVRDESGQVKSLVILLAIDLRGDENPLGFKFDDLAGLEKSLCYTHHRCMFCVAGKSSGEDRKIASKIKGMPIKVSQDKQRQYYSARSK
jgi:hypothetical protein